MDLTILTVEVLSHDLGAILHWNFDSSTPADLYRQDLDNPRSGFARSKPKDKVLTRLVIRLAFMTLGHSRHEIVIYLRLRTCINEI